MESINEVSLNFKENPYANYSFKDLSSMLKKERIENAKIEENFGI